MTRWGIRSGLFARAVAAIALLPLPAAACPNCYGASNPKVLFSYYLSAIALSLLPFIIVGTIGGVIWSLQRRLREADADLPDDPFANEPS